AGGVARARAKSPGLQRRALLFAIGQDAHAPVPRRVQRHDGRALHEREVVRVFGPLEAKRLALMANPDTADHRQFVDADINVLEGDVAAGKIKLGDPVDLLADVALGAESGAAKAGGVLNIADDRAVARALVDDHRVGVDASAELESRLGLLFGGVLAGVLTLFVVAGRFVERWLALTRVAGRWNLRLRGEPCDRRHEPHRLARGVRLSARLLCF